MKELYKTIGNFDCTNLIRLVSNQSLDDWNKYRFRQETYPVHSNTTTLPILFDKTYSRNVGEKTEYYSVYESEILKIEKQLQSIYKSNGKILRFVIVNLPAGKEVAKHTDATKAEEEDMASLKVDSRIHLPIQTNENVHFGIGDRIVHMKVGELWEINNHYHSHWVKNDGDTDRLHCILDYRADLEYNQSLI